MNRELELLPRILTRRQRRAHERANLTLREDELGEDWLVELNELDAELAEIVNLLSQDLHYILAQIFLAAIRRPARLLHPHRTGHQVRPGKRHFHGLLGMLLYKAQLVH